MLKKYWAALVFSVAFLILFTFEAITLFILGPIRFFQDMNDMAGTAYFLTMTLPYLRVVLIGLVLWSAYSIYKRPKRYPKILVGIALLLYVGLFYMSNFQLKADRLFYDQKETLTLPLADSELPMHDDVIGVAIKGESKAYPLDYLAYHHKVMDSVGGEPILVTYCVWCRSGRVFSPVVDGKKENFRLVGITNYNAIIEDGTSKTWWQQATGEAIAGPKKGQNLEEIYSEQLTLSSWAERYPDTKVLQPDSSYIKDYEHNSRFVSRYCVEDKGADYEPWKERSWVIGVENGDESGAFDFISLIDYNVLQDFIGDMPVVVVLEPDTIAFHSWDARIDDKVLSFEYDSETDNLVDALTGSAWDMTGTCISGEFEGERLRPVQSYEEYWYSWENFHPNTKKIYRY